MPASAWLANGDGIGLLFDGNISYGTYSSLGFPSGNSTITYSAWINPSAIASYPIIGYGNNGTGTWVILYMNATGKVTLEFGNSAGLVASTTTMIANTWYHVAATYDRTKTQIVINGVIEASTAYTTANININRDTDSTPVGGLGSYFSSFGTLGSSSGSIKRYPAWNGLLDDIRVYNRALTLSEIKLLAAKRGQGLKPINYFEEAESQLYPLANTPAKIFGNYGGTWVQGKSYANVNGVWNRGQIHTKTDVWNS